MKQLAVAKLLYGLLFVGLLPLLLVIWAAKTRDVVALPTVHSLSWGLVTAGVGLLLMGLGTASLWRLGGGLPMNAFPPPRYVSGGIYRVFSHPMYVGFASLCVGVAIAVGTASGLWLVSTTVILASAALVLGYELPDLQARFGDAVPEQRLLPPDDQSRPTPLDVGGVYLILSGIGRFVEEAYRGEPQTPIFWDLRLYQWIAMVTVFLGATITTLVKTPLTPEPILHLSSVLVALVCGIAAWFVSGVDFPESSRRFARLS